MRGVDNWNYVKKAVRIRGEREKEEREKVGWRGNKGTRCRHVTDVIDDHARNLSV